jgi:predicted N-acetyltransferase YhbS
MNDLNFTLRSETSHDASVVERLHERAFGPGRFARAAYLLREGSGHDMSLSFVAVVGTLVVGSIRLTRVHIAHTYAHFLGPLTVDPAFERKGIGKALMHKALHAAKEAGCELILLVGDEGYYQSFGFVRLPPYTLALPAPVDPMRFLGCALQNTDISALKGRVRAVRISHTKA